MTKSTGFRERARMRDAQVIELIRVGTSYDDICAATGIERTRISHLKRQAGLQHTERPACSAADCDQPQNANGYCRTHDQRLKKHGALELPLTTNRVTQWCRDNPDRVRVKARRYRAQNPEKRRAHRKIEVEIRTGRLVRQACQVCGNPKSHAHHDDYTKPLDVIWLCALHHMARHRYLTRQQMDPDAA